MGVGLGILSSQGEPLRGDMINESGSAIRNLYKVKDGVDVLVETTPS